MPAIADIALLLRLLAHLSDHRVAGHSGKEAVDVDRTKRAGEGDMLLRGQLLVAKEHDAVFAQCPPDLGLALACSPCFIWSRSGISNS
jgi:hypothetical protein